MEGHNHTHPKSGGSGLGLAFTLNAGFAVFELFGALATNSVAILADALHDLGDTISIGAAWGLETFSKKGKTARFSYGYKRFSLLGALLGGLILVSGSVYVVYVAMSRLMQPVPTNASGMFALAIVGVAINGLAVLRLREENSLNERMVSWHLLDDLLGWGAVLVVSVILLFWPLYWLDPALSLAVTLFILWKVGKALWLTLGVFLQSVPESVSIKKVEASLCKIPGVLAVHDSHVWSLDGANHILTTHAIVGAKTTTKRALAIKCAAKARAARLGITHATIEIELENETCDIGAH